MTRQPRPYFLALAAFLAAMPLAAHATVFFNDTFTNGSTVVSTTPAAPTTTNTAYQEISAKAWMPNPPTLANGYLRFGMGSSSSGTFEIQALFATNAIALTQPGDYIQLAMVLTNTAGVLTASGQLGIGLYNSGQVQPLPGGTNNATSSVTLTGYAQGWMGYMAILGGSSTDSSRIYTRPAQTITTANNQDLIANGSSSQAYANAVQLGGSYGYVTLTAGSTVTEVFAITMIDANTLGITNTLYSGVGTGGTVLTNYGATATGANLLTEGFDSFALGYRSRSATAASNVFDVASIQVSGSVTVITGPPTINTQPVPVTVATNGSCYFAVNATGFNMVYQWYRNGAVLTNSSNISGANSSTLIINNATVADAFSTANGYYCKITGAGNYSTNSATNSLTLVPMKNLEWNGTGTTWDFANTFWNDLGHANNPTNFNFGDAVTFDDVGAANVNVTLNDKFLSASKWLVSGSTSYAFNGSGYMGGSGQIVFNSSAAAIQMLGTNFQTGGTIVSNDNASLLLYCAAFESLGSGPLTLAKPGSLEIAAAGGPSSGFASNVVVNDDFTIQFDGTGSYAGVFLGDISGVSSKTLTLKPSNTGVVNRYRAYGNNTVCDANIAINANGTPTSQAQYDGTVLAPYGTGTQTYNGVISGYGGIIQRSGTTILNGANTFSGGTTPTTGAIGLGNDLALGSGALVIAPEVPGGGSTATIFASGGARNIANNLVYPSGTNNQTLQIGGTNSITLSGTLGLNGLDNLGSPTNRTLSVTNTGLTTLSGVISDGGAGFGLIKSGSGRLALSNTETYTGPTLVSGGTLLVNGTLGSGAVTVTNATLGGTGTIGGAVAIQTNSVLAPGNGGIGTLTINNTLTLAGGSTTSVEISKTGSTSDRVNVTTVSYNGTLAVTNLAGTLAANDQFTLFNATTSWSGNFTNVTGSAGAGLGFSFNPTNGVLTVVQTMAINPTNITFSVSGNTLNLTWPGDHQGWELQSNAVSLTSTGSWFVVPNSTTTTNVSITINPAAGNVFYRMHLP